MQEVHEVAAGWRGVLSVVRDEAGHGDQETPDSPEWVRDGVQAGKNVVCASDDWMADA